MTVVADTRTEPYRCTCRTTTGQSGGTQRWPATHAVHHGEATYTITRKHHWKCGLPAEVIDPATYGRRRRR